MFPASLWWCWFSRALPTAEIWICGFIFAWLCCLFAPACAVLQPSELCSSAVKCGFIYRLHSHPWYLQAGCDFRDLSEKRRGFLCKGVFVTDFILCKNSWASIPALAVPVGAVWVGLVLPELWMPPGASPCNKKRLQKTIYKQPLWGEINISVLKMCQQSQP